MSNCILVATVGGTPDPIVASVLHWHPGRVFFVVSPQSAEVDQSVLPLLRPRYNLENCRYESIRITDAESFLQTVNDLRHLTRRIAELPPAEVIADFTGGTKAMSAALALTAARRPNWKMSYVGGQERTKDGVGVVVSGTERIVHHANPWDALGIVAVDEALRLAQGHAFGAAKVLLDATKRRMGDLARKQELHALEEVVAALADWDRFQHDAAATRLNNLPRYTNDLEGALDHSTAQRLLRNAETLRKHCENVISSIGDPGKPRVSRELILDLLANAQRRLDEHRYDDATARLYRAIEAIAQLLLAGHGYPDTGAVAVEKLPESLREDVQATARDGVVTLGLQESWRLLAELNDNNAPTFKRCFSDPHKSALAARNSSILAHGFTPISAEQAKGLFDAALKLLGATSGDLIKFDWSPQ